MCCMASPWLVQCQCCNNPKNFWREFNAQPYHMGMTSSLVHTCTLLQCMHIVNYMYIAHGLTWVFKTSLVLQRSTPIHSRALVPCHHGLFEFTSCQLYWRSPYRYEMVFQQSVATEDAFLGMGSKTPLTASCEDLVVSFSHSFSSSALTHLPWAVVMEYLSTLIVSPTSLTSLCI